eukprot:maker-scaffold_20-snap-gene-5.14-mRNA-1 protein AED:0.38 eAED:0.38 QI:35/0.5/0.33/1/0/0/3/0/110
MDLNKHTFRKLIGQEYLKKTAEDSSKSDDSDEIIFDNDHETPTYTPRAEKEPPRISPIHQSTSKQPGNSEFSNKRFSPLTNNKESTRKEELLLRRITKFLSKHKYTELEE